MDAHMIGYFNMLSGMHKLKFSFGSTYANATK